MSVLVVGFALVLAGCTHQSAPPGPSQAPNTPAAVAAALARGLSKGDVSPVPFAGASGADVQAELARAVAGMQTRPAVSVARIDEQGSTATATLHHAWRFPGVASQWSYDTPAALVQNAAGWQVSWSPGLVAPGLSGGSRLAERRLAAPRGEILGADGEAIVKLRPVVRVGLDKSAVASGQAPASAARLAKLVGITPKTYATKVKAAGAKAFVEAIVLRADAKERPSQHAVAAIDGAEEIDDKAMLAPNRTFARAILGTVGPATKELVTASAGRVSASDQVGRSGLQRRYDEQLRGTPGVTVRLEPAKPASTASPSAGPSSPAASPAASPVPARTLFQTTPVAGADLSLTLSIPLQNLAERVLASTKPAAAVVAIRPSTGQVLAAANGPGSSEASVATVGLFPPGSTFKVVSSLALLRSGLRPSSPVTCPASVSVNGKKFTNYGDYPSNRLGRIDLRTALAQSCNTAFIGQRSRLPGTELADAAGSLGLGRDYDVGYASYFGSVPKDATATGQAAAMIGQGKVLASPLSLAAVAASVAAGRTVIPRLVLRTKAVPVPQPVPTATPLTETEAHQLRDMMASVVSSGSGHVLRGLPGAPVIAKTGTAEYGAKPPFRKHAWMIGAQGDLAVAVFVGTGSTGSHTAGPLLRRFLSGAR